MEQRYATILVVEFERTDNENGSGGKINAEFFEKFAECLDRLVSEHRGNLAGITQTRLVAEFKNASDAVRCALSAQLEFVDGDRNRNGTKGNLFRIGIDDGELSIDKGRIFGGGIEGATRLLRLVEYSDICISVKIRDHLDESLTVSIEPLGDRNPGSVQGVATAFRVCGKIAGTTSASKVETTWSVWPRLSFVIGIAAILVVVAAVTWQGQLTVNLAPSAPAKPDFNRDRRLTIAVLPFDTSGGGDDFGWLGDGIAEDIMTELSRFRDLGIVARNSSFRFTEQNVDLEMLHKDLGADLVLQGSVRLQNGSLRLSLQLVDTRTGTNRWADRYERPYSDISSIEEDVVSQIAAKLATQARESAASVATRSAPTDLKAYELVLRSRKLYYSFSREETLEALLLAERATKIDPNYSPAWEMIARLQIQFYLQPYDQRRGNPVTLERATEAARKAVTLDPTYSSARASYGAALVWAGQFEIGLEELQKAIDLNPNDSSAIGTYADALSKAGYQSESLETWEAAEQLDPLVLPINTALKARSYLLMGNTEAAFALSEACVERVPKLLPCQIFHAAAAHELGRTEDARKAAGMIIELAPKFTVSSYFKLIKYRQDSDVERIRLALLSAGLPD